MLGGACQTANGQVVPFCTTMHPALPFKPMDVGLAAALLWHGKASGHRSMTMKFPLCPPTFHSVATRAGMFPPDVAAACASSSLDGLATQLRLALAESRTRNPPLQSTRPCELVPMPMRRDSTVAGSSSEDPDGGSRRCTRSLCTFNHTGVRR